MQSCPDARATRSAADAARLAIEGAHIHCIDKKCPFTGNVSIRGRILSGIVKSMKMKRTVVHQEVQPI